MGQGVYRFAPIGQFVMKKFKFIIPIILMVVIIGAISGYFIYGSTLIDVTDEKSISDHLAVDPEQPITILKTAKSGEHFAVLYKDPTDEDENLYHFRYITKAKFYKNKYHNTGGYSTTTYGSLCMDEINTSDSERKTADVFIYRIGKTAESTDICSVFKYNFDESYINYDEITNEQQIITKIKEQAASLKKLDAFDLPQEDAFIIAKTYPIDKPTDNISIENGHVSEDEMRQSLLETADDAVRDYNAYKEAKNDDGA